LTILGQPIAARSLLAGCRSGSATVPNRREECERMAWKTQKPETAAAPEYRENKAMRKVINLGKTIQIKGDLTGNEDLTIEGQLEGKIFLKDHNLTIGENGNIKADVQAKGVVVVGKLIGNITADDSVEVATSGSMRGDIRAPRVTLADGAQFRGSIDMEPRSGSSADSASVAASAGRSRTASGERPRTPPPPGTTA
jgi:cytoskeletal protein CcmA (bactofilin family)